MTDGTKTTIKVTGFGETRFMAATVLHDGKTFHVTGFAVKLGRGAKFHGGSATFTVGNVNSDGAYEIRYGRPAFVLGRHGMIIDFWVNEKHNALASEHIHSCSHMENNVADPAIEAAALAAAKFAEGETVIYAFGGAKSEKVAARIVGVAYAPIGDLRYAIECDLSFGTLTGVREYELSPLPDPAPVAPSGDLSAAAAAVTAARKQGYDIYFGTMDFARVAATHGVSADGLHDYMVWHLAPAYVSLGHAPAPDPSFVMADYICQLCGRGFQAAKDVDNADVPDCLSCGSDMVQDVTPLNDLAGIDTTFFLEHDAVNCKPAEEYRLVGELVGDRLETVIAQGDYKACRLALSGKISQMKDAGMRVAVDGKEDHAEIFMPKKYGGTKQATYRIIQ